VVWVRLTFHDGTQVEYRDVQYLRQAEGLTLGLAPKEFIFFPWAALRSEAWEVA
jgi:hypothetical protein